MLFKFLAVITVGVFGGLVHHLIFNKKFYFPKINIDQKGRYIDFGFIYDVIVGVAVSLLVAIPIIEYVPMLNLVGSCLLPAITGKFFIKTLVKQFIEESKFKMQEELDALETLEKKQKENES